MGAHEYVGNLHVHTHYSDGEGSHTDVAEAAMLTGLDFLVFTDHNVRVTGIEGYYGDDDRGYVLLLSGEEIHNPTRPLSGDHLLVYAVEQEAAAETYDLDDLLATVKRARGLSFIAHPDDRAVDWLNIPAFPWHERDVEDFTGLEIWNFMSRIKDYLPNRKTALRNIFTPEDVMHGPPHATLELWDHLLSQGHHVVGIGNADAHAQQYTIGLVTHTIFPYDFLFSCVNTHILTKSPLTGETAHDRELLYSALRQGRAFIGYDIPGDTRGFRFTAQGQNTAAIMGETIRLGHGVTLQALAPGRAHIKIIRHGEIVAEETRAENATLVVREPGAYRVEVWREYRDSERAWILSNPIYVEANPSTLLNSPTVVS